MMDVNRLYQSQRHRSFPLRETGCHGNVAIWSKGRWCFISSFCSNLGNTSVIKSAVEVWTALPGTAIVVLLVCISLVMLLLVTLTTEEQHILSDSTLMVCSSEVTLTFTWTGRNVFSLDFEQNNQKRHLMEE